MELVATHIDRKHIHNHIVWNSTTLDCTHKFRDFLGSGRAVARLSDTICLEHRLSVIENPRRYVHGTYNKWLELMSIQFLFKRQNELFQITPRLKQNLLKPKR